MSPRTIAPEDLYELTQRNGPLPILDVRTPAEYLEIHAEGAHLFPLDQLDPTRILKLYPGHSEGPLYVMSRSSHRARRACTLLQEAGLDNVVVVEGGVHAWEQADLPVCRGEVILSLESQVSIVTGLLILFGVALGILVNPYFLILALFGGTTLIYDNLTDSFTLGILLARLPWNQVADH